jgi:hypothetical protein
VIRQSQRAIDPGAEVGGIVRGFGFYGRFWGFMPES